MNVISEDPSMKRVVVAMGGIGQIDNPVPKSQSPPGVFAQSIPKNMLAGSVCPAFARAGIVCRKNYDWAVGHNSSGTLRACRDVQSVKPMWIASRGAADFLCISFDVKRAGGRIDDGGG